MLIDLTQAPPPQAQLADLANELRLPAAYLDNEEGSARLSRLAAAASSIVERRTGHVVLTRQVELRLDRWPNAQRLPLPLMPIASLDAIGVLNEDGGSSLDDIARYRCAIENAVPTVIGVGGAALPKIDDGRKGMVRFTAGYGASWHETPADLRLAATLIAVALHDRGSEAGVDLQLPFGALALLEPYRRLRLWA
jgi:uncharacterized phiE125 gp8 family phage protein